MLSVGAGQATAIAEQTLLQTPADIPELPADSNQNAGSAPASAAARCKTGIVFQFPERHFLASTLLQVDGLPLHADPLAGFPQLDSPVCV